LRQSILISSTMIIAHDHRKICGRHATLPHHLRPHTRRARPVAEVPRPGGPARCARSTWCMATHPDPQHSHQLQHHLTWAAAATPLGRAHSCLQGMVRTADPLARTACRRSAQEGCRRSTLAVPSHARGCRRPILTPPAQQHTRTRLLIHARPTRQHSQ
jgi:hypothetical protein